MRFTLVKLTLTQTFSLKLFIFYIEAFLFVDYFYNFAPDYANCVLDKTKKNRFSEPKKYTKT